MVQARVVEAVGTDQIIYVRAAGSSLVIDVAADGVPQVLHWGDDLGFASDACLRALREAAVPPLLRNNVDRPMRVGMVPEARTGWRGLPGLSGHRAGKAWSAAFELAEVTVTDGADFVVVGVNARDDVAGLALSIEIHLFDSGVLGSRAKVTNNATGDYALDSLVTALPVPTLAGELLDFAGRWTLERVPQRQPFAVGSRRREGRRGRTGADAATLLVAGEPGFGFETGEVWGVHVAHSGNHVVYAERAFTGERLLGGGELLLPGEIVLAAGESYTSPWLYAAHAHGLDALAARFHGHLRSRPQHPSSPRPVILNVWEAVYFNHELDRLSHLADLAAEVGVELLVLDDGWFGARRNPTAGLGDWHVSPDVWPGDTLRRFVEHVKGLGMRFGLWFEPEMVNLDSDLARAHPEWIMQVDGRLPVEARYQQVLNIAIPEAYAHVRDRIVALVKKYEVDFVKWDHNRDLVDAGSTLTGRPGVHAQTKAVYRMIDEVRQACPGLEIESCSSGGGRVDLEILQRTERVWASDCNDAHDRQQIQRWTTQLIPPELMGSHVGPERSHTTGRTIDVSMRAATAMFGHFGIEWDLSSASSEDRAELARWVAMYKRFRSLVHTGTTLRRDFEDGALWLTGAVAPDRRQALYSVTFMDRPATWPPGPVRLPGLNPDLTYLVTPLEPQPGTLTGFFEPPWWTVDGTTLSGAVLGRRGVQIPARWPDEVVLLHVQAQGG